MSHSPRACIWLSVFVLFLELALLIVAAAYIWSYPYVGASLRWSNGEVVQVDADTPAFWAGLQANVRLMEIDQQLVIEGADKLKQKRVGDRVILTWLDGQRERTAHLKVIPTPPVILFWRLEPLLIACAFWLLGATVLALRPSAHSARFFFLICLVSVGIFCIGLLSAFGVLGASRLFNVLLCLLAPLLVHFHQLFLHPYGGLRLRRLFYFAALAISWPFLVWPVMTLRLFAIYSPLRTAGRILILISLLLCLFLLIRTYIYVSSLRQRIRLLVFGSSLGFLPLIFFSLLPNIVNQQSWLPYEISFIALLLIPTAYLWGIWKHNLFETDRIFNRTVVYTIIVFFFLSLYLLGAILLTAFLPDSKSSELVLVILLILFMALFQNPLLRWTQLVVDRVFYKGWVDTYSLGKQLSSKLATTLSGSQFLQLMTQELPEILSSRGAAIFLPANQSRLLQLQRSTGLPESAPLELSAQLTTLLSCQPTLEHSQLRKLVVGLLLTEEESLLLASDEYALWLPICFNDELEALLLLGPKRADEFYTHKEFEVLQLLTSQAATTLKNIELYQTLESQFFELKMKQKALKKAHRCLLVAREEERKALARSLHDSCIGDVIGISTELWTFSEDAQSDSLRSALMTLRSEALELLKHLRSICTDLRPPDLDRSGLGLASAIRTYIKKRAKESHLYELDLMSDAGRLPEQVAISLFRIFQEASKNSIKHANPQKILVELSLDEISCTLTITDDGDGFELPQRLTDLANNEHFGLLGMQERAELIGAKLKMTSKPGHGTIVFVYVPLPQPSSEKEPENENKKNSRRHS